MKVVRMVAETDLGIYEMKLLVRKFGYSWDCAAG